ncbi:MAG: glycosyltransferase [Clostridia bacterium]|nr:glycosyltransferase [Clostridia bacterium]
MKQKNVFKFIFYTITMVLSFVYIVYRTFYTLPLSLGALALCVSIIVLIVEIWEFVDFFVYYLNILIVSKKSPKIPSLSNIAEFPDIDVLIATLNEHESLLENTIEACKRMKYPDTSKIHIYVCDDGNRANIKKLSEKLNVGYISRLTNKNAKAGNYNHALSLVSSPYVATFDADMAPTENFLLTTLPFFFDNKNYISKKQNSGKNLNKIGFVQLPQSFINPDIFQYRFHLENKIPFEQDYFYHSIQIGKNATNSAVCCGTNTLFSRKALDDCGGFATNTISEDIATGMLIESKGYQCLALDNVEAYGIAANDLTGFVKQRTRWARGCIQILKKYKILGNSGLSFRQKLEYITCISYWFFGIRRMIYLLTPLLFSIFGIIIVDCNLTTFICFWLPAYLLKRFALDSVEGHKRSSTWNIIYETILTPVLFKEALKELFGFGGTKFEVTPKFAPKAKMSKTNIRLLFSHFTLLTLSIIGLIMCIWRMTNSNVTVYILSLVWLISNIFYLTISVIFDLRYKPVDYSNFIPNKIKKYKGI